MRQPKILFLGSLLIAASLTAQTYTFTTIAPPGLTGVTPTTINNAGQIVGYGTDGSGFYTTFLDSAGVFTNITTGSPTAPAIAINNNGQIVVGFPQSSGSQSVLYSEGVLTIISAPASTQTIAYGINNNGQIVGSFSDSNGTHGFVYIGGAYTTIDVPAALGAAAGGTTATGINDKGYVVGSFTVTDPSSCNCTSLAFLDSSGSFSSLPPNPLAFVTPVPGVFSTVPITAVAINNTGQVIGTSHPPFPVGSSFLYSGGVFTQINPPPAGTAASANYVTALNNSGQIIVVAYGYAGSPNGTMTWVYANGVFTPLPLPDFLSVTANAINDAGQIVGNYAGSAFVANPALAPQTSYTYMTVDPPGITGPSAAAINDAGQIVGWGYGANNATSSFLYSGGIFTSISVPGSISTFAKGINKSGQIAGTFDDSIGAHGFVDDAGALTTIDAPGARPGSTGIGAINDAGQVAGTCGCPGLVGFFIDTSGAFDFISTGYLDSSPVAMNSSDQVVGNADSFGGGISFLYSGGVFAFIPAILGLNFNGTPGAATGINNSGQIVIAYETPYSLREDPGGALTAIWVPGSSATGAGGINDLGQIVGGYTDSSGQDHIFLATPSATLLTPAQLATTASGLAYSRVSKVFVGTITITNISGAALNGPFQLLFASLPAGVTLANTSATYNGSPYITANVASLAPGESATVAVRFADPSNVAIEASPAIYSGSLN